MRLAMARICPSVTTMADGDHMIEEPPASAAMRHTALRPMMIVLLVFAAFALWIAVRMPFPSTYDELQHLSVVRAQAEAPDLFADARHYRVADVVDAERWTKTPNYINHPALYYLTLAPVYVATHSILMLRLANVAIALIALAIMLWAGMRRLASAEHWPFAILAGAFPKAAVIAGMINNDNLAALAGAAVFAGVAGAPGAAWWIAGGLALAGWSKLTALIALGAVAAIHHAVRSDWQPRRLFSRTLLPITVGVAVGALPYLVTWLRSGALLYVNDAAFFVAPALRPVFHPINFTTAFLHALAMKWPAAESHLPFAVALATLLVPLMLAGAAAAHRGKGRALVAAYLAGAIILLAIHLWFAWEAYQRIGDLTIAQPRYYGVLWPGIALGAGMAIARLPRTLRPLALAVCIVPTVLGATILAVVGL